MSKKKYISLKDLGDKNKGILYIYSSFNNTIMTLVNAYGKTVGWVSSGTVGFKGFHRSTAFAGKKVGEQIKELARKNRIAGVNIIIKGVGKGRPKALHALQKSKLLVNEISDVTPISHNGCRPPKRRRI